MSKDQKKTIEISVDFVENLQEILVWISFTITFWKMDKIWPTNLIKNLCDFLYDEIKYDKLKDFKKVSLSHIIDK